MTDRPRSLLPWMRALAGVGLVALAGLALRDLNLIATTLADPAPLIEQVVSAHLAAGYEEPALRADDPLVASRAILITADVNERSARDVVARLMYLNALDRRRPIDLYLSTQGGWIDSAFTIIDAMDLIEAPVNTWAIGGCYSSGALILAAGTGRRYATENAVLMIHASLDEESEPGYSYERLARERYERVWRERAQLPADWFPMVGDEEYYLSPQDALQFKIIDEIVPAKAPQRRREKDRNT